MSMALNRVTQGVTFDHSILEAEYTEKPVGQALGNTQHALLPGETTVSEALANVFPKDPTVAGLIAGALAKAGSSMSLRSARGFRSAALRTVAKLRGSKGKAAQAAADEIDALLADSELLDGYRAALLES